MTLRLKSYFQGEGSATGADWDDLFDSVPMLKSETADGASAVAGYVDTSTAWSTAGAKLWEFRNNGVVKASVDRGGAVVGSSFAGDGSALTSLNGSAVASGLVPTTYGGTGIDCHLAADGKLLIGNGVGFTLATLTAGSNITITNGAGTITLASTATASAAGAAGEYQKNTAGVLAGANLYDSGSGIGIGGTSSSVPGLHPLGAVLQAKLADDTGWTSFAAGQFWLQTDLFLTREGAAALRLGDVDAGAPQNQRLAVQGSRAGTDTNTAGASLTIASGIGTGSASGSSIFFSCPIVGSTGTTAQSVVTSFEVNGAFVKSSVGFGVTLGTITSNASTFAGTVTWNSGGTTFTGISLIVTNTSSAATSLLIQLKVGVTIMFSVRVDGLAFITKAQYGTDTTGGGSALLGANCPAVTVAAPYTWQTVLTSDGSTGYVPVWK